MTIAEQTLLLAALVQSAFREHHRRQPTLDEAVTLAEQMQREWERAAGPHPLRLTSARVVERLHALVREVSPR